MAALHARGMIADYQFAAGRDWQRYYEAAQIGALKAPIPPSNRSTAVAYRWSFLPTRATKAVAKLIYCRAILGETGNAIVTLVLGANMPIQQAALARGMITRRELEYVGQRFREALATSQGCSAMRDLTHLAGRPGSTERLEAIMLRTEQVVAWREAGYLQRQIAQRLGISRTTVMLIEKRWARGRFGYGGCGYWRKIPRPLGVTGG